MDHTIAELIGDLYAETKNYYLAPGISKYIFCINDLTLTWSSDTRNENVSKKIISMVFRLMKRMSDHMLPLPIVNIFTDIAVKLLDNQAKDELEVDELTDLFNELDGGNQIPDISLSSMCL